MPLTVAESVRLRIQDQARWFDEARLFDGSAQTFDLPQRNITSATAYVADTAGRWTATGATIDPSGFVAFSAIGSANSAYRVRGVQSVFSDAEISQFTAVGGTVAGAALEAVRTLMFDGLKRASWAAPDGSQWDDTAAMSLLNVLHAQLLDELAGAEVGSGGFVSWAEGQGDWI